MSVYIGRVHWSQRDIVRDNHISGSAFLQYAQLLLEIAVGNLCIALKEHLGNLAPGRIGVAEVMFVKNIGYLEGFCHIMGVTVGSQAGENASVHNLHGRRASAGIAHVGLRVMYHHGIRILDQLHLMRIYVNAVGQQGLFPKDIAVHQTVHNSLSVLLKTVVEILDALCHMDVVSHLSRLVGCRQLHGLI